MPIRVETLARGGKLITAGEIRIQLGAYPETIKDTMGSGVPHVYLLPRRLFDSRQGVSAADIEFPVYYNYYRQGRKITLITRREQLRPVLRVLREAIFGPRRLLHEWEYPQGRHSLGFPDLAAEMAYFNRDPRARRGRLQLGDLVEPIVFDREGVARYREVTVTALEDDDYRFTHAGESLTVKFDGSRPEAPQGSSDHSFEPPMFGITVIGSGHGFDASTVTSGFIVWLEGRGVLVDPPVHSTTWLRQNGVDTRLIDDIILTHCHADHDSGTLQKILEEGRVTLHTTPTILTSFVTKYRALTGFDQAAFMSLFNFSPVPIDQPVHLCGGEFRFKYRLHSIPTIGFEVFSKGRSFVYSSDTVYCERTFRRLHRLGVLSRSRMSDLRAFPWHSSLVLHEAGPPPIHTPISSLVELPEEVKKNLYVIHVSEEAIPPDSGLRLAPTGVENTLKLPVTTLEADLTHKMLDVLAHVDLFRTLTVDKAIEFVRLARHESYQSGEVIVRQDTEGDRFYMIVSGEVEVRRDGRVIGRASRYDYFGEVSLFLDVDRVADVVADGPVELLSMGRADFYYFIRGTGLATQFRRVAENRVLGCWPLLEESEVLSSLSSYQKTQLLSIMNLEEYPEGTVLYAAGEPVTSFFMIDAGEVLVEKKSGKRKIVGRGRLLGRLERTLSPGRHTATATCVTDLIAYEVSANDLLAFLRSNPGAYVRLLEARERERRISG